MVLKNDPQHREVASNANLSNLVTWMEVTLSPSAPFSATVRLPRFRQTRPPKRHPLRAVAFSSSSGKGFNLKPRPALRPTPPTHEPETFPEDARLEKPRTLALSTKIEKLVLFKRHEDALELFHVLRSRAAPPLRATTYDSLATACMALGSLWDAKAVFQHMVDTGFEFDRYMWNRVTLMHVRCGSMEDARNLFDEMPDRDVISWNTILSGLVDGGSYGEALDMFSLMWEETSNASTRTFVTAISATAGSSDVRFGRQLHSSVTKVGFSVDIFISCALIDMYCKCGCAADAWRVFEGMPTKTVVAWNTIIAGYVLNGYSEEALALYGQMRGSGVRMDHFTYSILLRICARLSLLEHAKQVHATLVRDGFGSDVVANTALVDLYSKWGRMEDARHVFDRMPRKNVKSWNALIGGYGNNGNGEEAVRVFENMLKEGRVPNHVSFLGVLRACSYSGLVDRGWDLFQAISAMYSVKPRAMHYACMIELLGREGRLDEALALIKEAPFSPTSNMWGALLTACRIHKNLELAELAAKKLVTMESVKIGSYMVLLNIYTSSGRLDEAAKVLETMKRKGMRLLPTCSWIEIHRQSHMFLFNDRSHPLMHKIYKKLDVLMKKAAKLGYFPFEKTFLPDVGEHEESLPRHHSEKLAVAFGLLITSESTSLQVVQSHRLCTDCHKAIKFFSLITGRGLIVRDSSRFHHFKDGVCSCGDYW